MSGMRIIGVQPRARDLRNAANRLRWEVDAAIEQGKLRDVVTSDLAEAIGILTNVLTTLERAMPEGPVGLALARAQFAQQLAYYTDYHRVAR